MDLDLVTLGIIASVLAGSATAIGALPVLFLKRISHVVVDASLGFSAGIMTSASIFSLLVPALEMGDIAITLLGFVAGSASVFLIDKYVPHTHIVKGLEGPTSRLSSLSLMIIAITVHNFPEGMAVGVSFGTGNIEIGIVIATAIALQNIPEGTAVAFPFTSMGMGKFRAIYYTLLTGLVEPIGAAIGVLLATHIAHFLPFGLAYAAGAMIYVVSDEMVPESHRLGHEEEATFGFISGFVIMMLLDNIFG